MGSLPQTPKGLSKNIVVTLAFFDPCIISINCVTIFCQNDDIAIYKYKMLMEKK